MLSCAFCARCVQAVVRRVSRMQASGVWQFRISPPSTPWHLGDYSWRPPRSVFRPSCWCSRWCFRSRLHSIRGVSLRCHWVHSRLRNPSRLWVTGTEKGAWLPLRWVCISSFRDARTRQFQYRGQVSRPPPPEKSPDRSSEGVGSPSQDYPWPGCWESDPSERRPRNHRIWGLFEVGCPIIIFRVDLESGVESAHPAPSPASRFLEHTVERYINVYFIIWDWSCRLMRL